MIAPPLDIVELATLLNVAPTATDAEVGVPKVKVGIGRPGRKVRSSK